MSQKTKHIQQMEKTHYAAIDIGSNAVRLLIKCVNEDNEDEKLSKVQLIRVPLRLGIDSFTIGKITTAKRRKLISLMNAYKELMQIYDVVEYRACATSAMRDAINKQDVVKDIYIKTGIIVEIIDGHEEAQLISDNKIEKMINKSDDVFIYCDVGGGSTEINLVKKGHLIESRSFDIGTVRYISGRERPEERQALCDFITKLKGIYGDIKLIGSGGNINKLLRMGAPDQRDNVNFLPAKSLFKVVEELKQYSSEERMIKFRLKPDRADVIVPAGDIFSTIVRILDCDGVIVPRKGLSDGILDSIYKKHYGQEP